MKKQTFNSLFPSTEDLMRMGLSMCNSAARQGCGRDYQLETYYRERLAEEVSKREAIEAKKKKKKV